MNKTVIIIAGPTASGKTSLAIRLAQHYHTEIISADSRQCFRELNIGVAKPSSAELSVVKHYFVNSHTVHEEVNAAVFEQYALRSVEHMFNASNVAVMAGGTGLYIKAFCEGLDEMPAISETIRNNIIENFGLQGISWLQEQVRLHDPLFYKEGEMQNPQRMMRALEIKLATGRSIKELQKKEPVKREFNIVKYGIDVPKDSLHSNINARVDKMMTDGLLEEVISLLPLRHLNALQTVGYTELFEYLDGKHTLAEAVERIKINTRQYAKRQLTWFRKDPDIKWINAEEAMDIIKI